VAGPGAGIANALCMLLIGTRHEYVAGK
jgi:hypothetical protein